jgi:hypothetical protein
MTLNKKIDSRFSIGVKYILPKSKSTQTARQILGKASILQPEGDWPHSTLSGVNRYPRQRTLPHCECRIREKPRLVTTIVHVFFFNPHFSRPIYVVNSKATMDLAELVNPKVNFSKTTLEDVLARYTVKNKDSTSTTNKTPQSVKTALSALSQAYARIFGHRPDDDYGDLLWLTLSNLKQPSKYARARPLFQGFAHPNASAAMAVPVEVTTLRKNLENFRSLC